MKVGDTALAPLTDDNQELLDRIRDRLDVIWGVNGNPNTKEERDWLLAIYGVSDEEETYWYDLEQYYLEEEENRQQFLTYEAIPEDERAEMIQEMHDQDKLNRFLTSLLAKYEAKDVVYDFWAIE